MMVSLTPRRLPGTASSKIFKLIILATRKMGWRLTDPNNMHITKIKVHLQVFDEACVSESIYMIGNHANSPVPRILSHPQPS